MMERTRWYYCIHTWPP